jgi:hypothetical protein
VLYPGEIHGAERVACDAGGPVVKVLVDVAVEKRVQVHETLGGRQPDGLLNPGVGQPFLRQGQFSKAPTVVKKAAVSEEPWSNGDTKAKSSLLDGSMQCRLCLTDLVHIREKVSKRR